MTKLLAAAAAVTLLFAVQIRDHAQAQERQQGQDACGRDSTRLCKAVINDGDQAVLACLKQNRARLRAVCVKFLQEKGQL